MNLFCTADYFRVGDLVKLLVKDYLIPQMFKSLDNPLTFMKDTREFHMEKRTSPTLRFIRQYALTCIGMKMRDHLMRSKSALLTAFDSQMELVSDIIQISLDYLVQPLNSMPPKYANDLEVIMNFAAETFGRGNKVDLLLRLQKRWRRCTAFHLKPPSFIDKMRTFIKSSPDQIIFGPLEEQEEIQQRVERAAKPNERSFCFSPTSMASFI